MRTAQSITEVRKVGCGDIYIHIVYRDDGTFHYLLVTPPTETRELCGSSNTEALARVITFGIRRCNCREDAEALIKQLKNQRCSKYSVGKKFSCSDAIADVLTDVILPIWDLMK